MYAFIILIFYYDSNKLVVDLILAVYLIPTHGFSNISMKWWFTMRDFYAIFCLFASKTLLIEASEVETILTFLEKNSSGPWRRSLICIIKGRWNICMKKTETMKLYFFALEKEECLYARKKKCFPFGKLNTFKMQHFKVIEV